MIEPRRILPHPPSNQHQQAQRETAQRLTAYIASKTGMAPKQEVAHR